MIELERFDKETGIAVEPPFYLLEDGSMINSLVFRSPSDVQYAVLSSDTFDRCKGRIITSRYIEWGRLDAQLDHFPNALNHHAQYINRLWTVCQVSSFENWYNHSRFIGFLFPSSDRLPKTYAQFQGKRDELARKQEAFERRIGSITPINTEPILF
jgi:hypothetical protein